MFADDSFVSQLLLKYPLYRQFRDKTQKGTEHGWTEMLVFANKSMRLYHQVNGSVNPRRYLGGVSRLNSRGGEDECQSPIGKYMSDKKRQLALLIATGMTPAAAYAKAYNVGYVKARTVAYRAIIDDPLMLKEIKKHMKENIMDDLEKAGMTGDYLINEIKKTIEENRTNSQVRAAMLLFLTKIKYGLQDKGGAAFQRDMNDIRSVGANVSISLDNDPESIRKQLLERSNAEL